MCKTIAFSGYRSEKLPENIDPIRINLRETVLSSIEEGYDTFLCGMADGFDLMAANVVLEFKPQYDLKLINVLLRDMDLIRWKQDLLSDKKSLK